MEEQILTLVNQTNKNIFLTGKAGTGKTTLLHKIINTSYKNTVVVAPTGIAALNASGVTIHSLFQLPFASFLPSFTTPAIANEYLRFENRESLRKHFKMHKNKIQLIRNMELLIVDEVSMLRADIVDAMDFILQQIRKNKHPFGGVQVLFIGDLLQLPPVVKQEEWEVLKHYYKGMFFFHSQVIQQNPLLYVELEKIYRQTDKLFISILNHLRENKLSQEDLRQLAPYVKPEFAQKSKNEYVTLTTHNAKADTINQHEMAQLKTPLFTYKASVVGDFPEYLYPIEKVIQLKKGARVMFIKNDTSPEHLFFNGKMGTVYALSEQSVEVALDGGNIIIVEQYEWENIRFKVNENTKDIEEELLGTFTQYPLRLAWAITIHKSQGLTFEKAILDLDSVFASGQAYVAFSRLRSMNGLILLSSVNQNGIDNEEEVIEYAGNKASEEELITACEEGKIAFMKNCISQTFYWQPLLEEWVLHQNSYTGEIGLKNNYKTWAGKQLKQMQTLNEIAEKFSKQLQGYFMTNTPLNLIFERVEKAIAYFKPLLEDFWYELLYVEAKLMGQKKVKDFSKEIAELDDSFAELLKRLFRLEQMIALAQRNEHFNKEKINSDKLQKLRDTLRQKVYDNLKKEQLFVQPMAEKAPSEGKEKPKKPSTYEATLQKWNEGKTISQIASERMLSENTIYQHLLKLIATDKLSVEIIRDSFDEEDFEELNNAFEAEEDPTKIKGVYEKLDGKYTWEELRFFKEYYLRVHPERTKN